MQRARVAHLQVDVAHVGAALEPHLVVQALADDVRRVYPALVLDIEVLVGVVDGVARQHLGVDDRRSDLGDPIRVACAAPCGLEREAWQRRRQHLQTHVGGLRRLRLEVRVAALPDEGVRAGQAAVRLAQPYATETRGHALAGTQEHLIELRGHESGLAAHAQPGVVAGREDEADAPGAGVAGRGQTLRLLGHVALGVDHLRRIVRIPTGGDAQIEALGAAVEHRHQRLRERGLVGALGARVQRGDRPQRARYQLELRRAVERGGVPAGAEQHPRVAAGQEREAAPHQRAEAHLLVRAAGRQRVLHVGGEVAKRVRGVRRRRLHAAESEAQPAAFGRAGLGRFAGEELHHRRHAVRAHAGLQAHAVQNVDAVRARIRGGDAPIRLPVPVGVAKRPFQIDPRIQRVRFRQGGASAHVAALAAQVDSAVEGIERVVLGERLAAETDVTPLVDGLALLQAHARAHRQPVAEIPLGAEKSAVAGAFRQRVKAGLGLDAPVGLLELRDLVHARIGVEPFRQHGVGHRGRTQLVLVGQRLVFRQRQHVAVQPVQHRKSHAARPATEPYVVLRAGEDRTLEDGGLALRPVQARVTAVRDGCPQARAAKLQAAADGATPLAVAAFGRPVVVQVHLDAFVVLARDDVHHAAHRVRAVHGGRAVQHHFHALDHGERYGGHVRDATEKAAVPDALAVHQDQRRFAAEAAQIHGGAAAQVECAVQLAADPLGSGVEVLRQLAQHPLQGGLACGLDEIAVQHHEVAGQLVRVARQAAAGDDHLLDDRLRHHRRVFQVRLRRHRGVFQVGLRHHGRVFEFGLRHHRGVFEFGCRPRVRIVVLRGNEGRRQHRETGRGAPESRAARARLRVSAPHRPAPALSARDVPKAG